MGSLVFFCELLFAKRAAIVYREREYHPHGSLLVVDRLRFVKKGREFAAFDWIRSDPILHPLNAFCSNSMLWRTPSSGAALPSNSKET